MRPRRCGFHEAARVVPVAGVGVDGGAVLRSVRDCAGVQLSDSRGLWRDGAAVDAGELSAAVRSVVPDDSGAVVCDGFGGDGFVFVAGVPGRAVYCTGGATSE